MRIKTSIYLFVFLATISSVYSQDKINFEESVIKRYKENNADAYDLLNAINYKEALYTKGKKEIDAHINSLKTKNLHLKPLKKQIQTIYKSTHAKFLSKYKSEAYFNQIFENGSYNCVTASALYALIFDAFKINYAIKETPTHVYIIADTLGLQTLIESTSPANGVISYNEKYKKDFVAYLNANKIISDTEFQNSTTDELFRAHYSKDNTIKLSELAALQYYNKGVFLMMDEKYSGAATYLNKALIFYPSASIKYNHYSALQNAVIQDYNNKSFDGKLYGKFLQSSIEDISLHQLLFDFFDNISLILCVNEPDMERYNRFYQDIISVCSKEKIPEDIVLKYHYFKAVNLGVNGDYPLALSELTKAYPLNTDNLSVKSLAQEVATKHLFIENNYKNQIDSMEYYFQEMPFLLENKIFQQQYVYYYMRVISENFSYDGPQVGEEYYTRFLHALDSFQIDYYIEDHIAIGYSSMAYYYADNEQFSKATQLTNKGLELSPESLRLKQLKEDIEDERQRIKRYANYKATYTPSEDVVYVDKTGNTTKTLQEEVITHFPGKWKAVAIVMEDMEQDLTKKETFEFDAEKDKDCTYTQNGKTETGKWAYRPKSKCIYFVPDHDKDKYRVFKVKEISSDRLIILPYKDQKTPSPYKYLLKPNS